MNERNFRYIKINNLFIIIEDKLLKHFEQLNQAFILKSLNTLLKSRLEGR